VVGACLALIAALAWGWLLGMGAMADMDMGMPMAPSHATQLGAAFLMWLVMMVAMMLPSAAPMILLYAHFSRQAQRQGAVPTPVAVFAGVYLLLWAGFSLVAAAVQTALAGAGLLSPMTLALGDARVAGGLLIAAGVYQLTPLKRRCLVQCRSPATFITRLWRPGWTGAVRLGAVHGLYCLGCCWLIMALLFVGGVMNLAWVGLLAVLVLVEKVAPFGRQVGIAVGALAIGIGALLLVSPWL
jgi:predicted metal-binding membrane protein